MNLPPLNQRVYEYIKAHPGLTTKAIDDALGTTRTSARISEINYAYQQAQGIEHPDLKDMSKNLIINAGKLKNGRVTKMLRTNLTKKVQRIEMTANGVREWFEEVAV